ncbi:MAG: hypothetical protein RLZZ303_1032 [Candidatus Hydrogenedentota bacterium]
MRHITAEDLQRDLQKHITDLAARNEPMVISRENHVVAIMLPANDEMLIEELEDRIDLEAARIAMAEEGDDISLESLEHKLGL